MILDLKVNFLDAQVMQRAVFWYQQELEERIQKRKEMVRINKRPNDTIFTLAADAEYNNAQRVHKFLKENVDEWIEKENTNA